MSTVTNVSVLKHRKLEFWEEWTPRPFFWHLRHYDDESGETLPTGGITLAWRYFPDQDLVHLALSMCNITDHFNKAKGRLLAAGRLLSPEREAITVDPKLRTLSDKDLRKALKPLLDEFETRRHREWHIRRNLDV
ncbi:MAG: hypothetical protein MN733_07720 [Nitrososphaera sp.]|nr:hypothetical protein [Nitrososphaera sp.]